MTDKDYLNAISSHMLADETRSVMTHNVIPVLVLCCVLSVALNKVGILSSVGTCIFFAAAIFGAAVASVHIAYRHLKQYRTKRNH